MVLVQVLALWWSAALVVALQNVLHGQACVLGLQDL